MGIVRRGEAESSVWHDAGNNEGASVPRNRHWRGGAGTANTPSLRRDRWAEREEATAPSDLGAQGRCEARGWAIATSRRPPRERNVDGRRRNRRRRHESALAAVRATRPFGPVNAVHERRHRLLHHRIGCRHRERRAGLRQLCRLARRSQEAIMADTLEALGQDMQQKAVDEGLRRQGQCSLGVALSRSAHPEAHLTRIDPDDCARSRSPPGACTVSNNGRCEKSAMARRRVASPLLGRRITKNST